MNRTKFILIAFATLIPFIVLVSSSLGAYDIPLSDLMKLVSNGLKFTEFEVSNQSHHIFWYIRLPRIIFGLLIGSTLSVAGAGMQGLFRNPLADPGLVGVSSGAVLFTAIYLILGWHTSHAILGNIGLSLFTFSGATLTTLIIFKLASSNQKTNVSHLLLAGIAINALCSAGTGFLIFLADDSQLRDLTFWTLGSLGSASWKLVLTLIPFVLVTLFFIPTLAKRLDAFTLGEQDAESLGVNVQRMKLTLIILVALGVGVCVAFSGMIGFVGLVVPHVIRLLVGSNHKSVFFLSILLGGSLLCIADLFSRLIVMPAELPIGIITAILGTPMFLYLLINQNKKASLDV